MKMLSRVVGSTAARVSAAAEVAVESAAHASPAEAAALLEVAAMLEAAERKLRALAAGRVASVPMMMAA